MLQTENVQNQKKNTSRMIPVVPEEGLFSSMLINVSPEAVFTLCQDEKSLERVVQGLPLKAEKILKLELEDARQGDDGRYEVRFKNHRGSKLSGELRLFIGEAYNGRGTLLAAEAGLDLWSPHSDSPSTLMNAFLKRFKALIETGEIATIQGQPSGREELKTLH